MPIRIESFDLSRIDDAAELQKELWSDSFTTNKAYLKWKYFDNPECEEPVLFLALEGDRVVGMRGCCTMKWMTPFDDGQAILAGSPSDSVVHPRYRRRGISKALSQAANEKMNQLGYGFNFGFLTNSISITTDLALGMEPVRVMDSYSWIPPNFDSILTRSRRKFLTVNPFRFFDAFNESDQPGISLSPNARAEQMMALIKSGEGSAATGQFRRAWNERSLKWRFKNPLAEYRFLYLDLDDRLQGYTVLHAEPRRYGHRVHIVDWRVAHKGLSEPLLRAATEACPECVLTVWSDAIPKGSSGLLDELGFKSTPALPDAGYTQPHVLILPISVKFKQSWISDHLDRSSWELRLTDCDGF